jgi:L-ascorbate metabolism protein UlaG (beta-lactamase superfamily)
MSFFTSFGRRPGKKARERYSHLFNYKDGQFQNPVPTPALAEGQSMPKILWEFFQKHPETSPDKPLPSVQTDLKRLHPLENVLVWFGHSSYFIQLDGKRFLVDPVFSGNASPIPGSLKSFPGTNTYQAEDMPAIDFLIITHDHWDHLDYKTIKQLKQKTDKVICGLGVAEHFLSWGWEKDRLIERNWWEAVNLAPGFRITLTPARHFSGRGFKRNVSLWTSYVLQTPSMKIFIGGDSGYAPHFKTIGDQFGPFDLAILECGQYNKNWPYIHSTPEEVVQEAKDLKAAQFLPVHHSKFKLAQHPWYEPVERLKALAGSFSIITPLIGEKVKLEARSEKGTAPPN